jgi:hypothetical protein
MLIGALAAVLGVGAGIGIALGGSKDQNDTGTFDPGASQAISTPGPVVSLAPPPTQGPQTPRPATQAPVTPTPGPTPQQGGGSTGGRTIDAATYSVTIPTDWQVDKQENTVLSAFTPKGGQLFIQSGTLDSQLTTAQVLKDAIDTRKAKSPDLKVCKEEGDAQFPNGPRGRSITLCYTLTPTSGAAYPAVVFIAALVDTSGDKPVLYFLKVFAADKDWDAVLEEIRPVLPSIHWKLYQGG